MEEVMEFEFSKEFLDRFEQALINREDSYIKDSLQAVRPVDICEISLTADCLHDKNAHAAPDGCLRAKINVNIGSTI